MVRWIAAASGLGLGWVVLRWWRTGPDALGRPAPKPWVGGCLLALVFVSSTTVSVRHHLRENRLSGVASTLAGRSVRVECQSYAGAFLDANVEHGYVRFGADGRPEASTTLKADVCRSLARYMRSSKRHPSQAQVVAVHIVTHEAMHMAGLADEREAECAAVQRDAMTARLLGADQREATALAIRYRTTVYPLLPDDYRSTSCALDTVADLPPAVSLLSGPSPG